MENFVMEIKGHNFLEEKTFDAETEDVHRALSAFFKELEV